MRGEGEEIKEEPAGPLAQRTEGVTTPMVAYPFSLWVLTSACLGDPHGFIECKKPNSTCGHPLET